MPTYNTENACFAAFAFATSCLGRRVTQSVGEDVSGKAGRLEKNDPDVGKEYKLPSHEVTVTMSRRYTLSAELTVPLGTSVDPGRKVAGSTGDAEAFDGLHDLGIFDADGFA
ncbi:hypothetical protein K435DRAFT_797820 [Dendrothele bispora CBS 962.96]|uniref:Uncharacterized protein n=1 Tax=Dendrothele bispora (strain CBS 962.96) TaxID=1314807 RepID=A0A4S8M1S0_DENBC|nr:hypothetical protein K435DRAFT_797820 [Dendrothele bispora CBS 962.96]